MSEDSKSQDVCPVCGCFHTTVFIRCKDAKGENVERYIAGPGVKYVYRCNKCQTLYEADYDTGEKSILERGAVVPHTTFSIEVTSSHIEYPSKMDISAILREIADKIDEGYTQGQFVGGRPPWKLTENTRK